MTEHGRYHYVTLTERIGISTGRGCKSYYVIYHSKTEFGAQSWELGVVESFRELRSVMHKAEGLRNIARKNTHRKSWRFSLKDKPGQWLRHDSRRAALAWLLDLATDMGMSESTRLATEASVRKGTHA